MSTVALHHRLDGPEHAPVLVLANSIGTDLSLWDDEVAALSARWRVLRYDPRGHGRSPAPAGPYKIDDLGADLLALLDRLGIERASICGLSLGGMVAMWVAINAPERVDRLVLCATAPRLGPPELWTERAEAVRADGMEAVLEGVLERWFTAGFRDLNPAAVERVAGMLRATPAEGYASCCEAIRELDLRDALAAIEAPTLVIAGAEDPATPPEGALELRAAIAGARLVVLPEAAHIVHLAQPDAFGAALVDHLGGSTGTHASGMRVRREVLGDEHVDASIARTTDFTAGFQDLITRYAWGEIWTRPGLDRRTRSCVTLTALVALNRLDELAMHVRAALRNGLSRGEIEEVLLQSAIYCGVPAANSAFAVAQRVLRELEDPA